jgi:D-glycero-D-manno-heptose 1,7-bisphosphate phosphatase
MDRSLKPAGHGQRPCVFFDRDGIVNEPPVSDRYVLQTDAFIVIPTFFDALALVRDKGYEAVVVTNQRAVGLGTMSQKDLDAVHGVLYRELRKRGLTVTDLLACVAADDEHPWRKPNAGMLLEAAKRHELDLHRSWMVGDQETDVAAGQRAGCRTILVSSRAGGTEATYRIASMKELCPLLDSCLEGCASP